MAFLKNADRDRDETIRRMRSVIERLDSLEKNQEKVIEELEVLLKSKSTEAKGKLADYIRSDGFREKFCAWSHDDGPPANPESWKETECRIQESLQRWFNRLIQEWEQEHHIFENVRQSLIQQVALKFKYFEEQLEFLLFSDTADKREFGGPLTLAGGVLALPRAATTLGIVSVIKNLQEEKMKRKIEKYEDNRGLFLQVRSSTYLSSFLDHEEGLSEYAEYLMKNVEFCLEQVKAGIPNLIKMDRQLYRQLKGEKRSKEEIKKIYISLKEDCECLSKDLKMLFEGTQSWSE